MTEDRKLYFGGMPTGPDIKLIEKALGELPIGRVIEYREIEKVIGHAWNECRFRTVVSRWRKQQLAAGIRIGAVVGVGFKVLDPHERLKEGQEKAHRGVRSVRRGARLASLIEDVGLTKAERQTRERIQAFAAITSQENRRMPAFFTPLR